MINFEYNVEEVDIKQCYQRKINMSANRVSNTVSFFYSIFNLSLEVDYRPPSRVVPTLNNTFLKKLQIVYERQINYMYFVCDKNNEN